VIAKIRAKNIAASMTNGSSEALSTTTSAQYAEAV